MRLPPRPIPGRAARPYSLQYIQSGRQRAVRPRIPSGFDAWVLLSRACPVRVACMGRHGPDRPFAIEIAGHGCIPGDRGVDRALRFVLKRALPRSCRCSYQRHGAGPALSWFEIAVSVTSSTVTMLPSPSIPASALEALAGFRGHLVAMGRGRRRGPSRRGRGRCRRAFTSSSGDAHDRLFMIHGLIFSRGWIARSHPS